MALIWETVGHLGIWTHLEEMSYPRMGSKLGGYYLALLPPGLSLLPDQYHVTTALMLTPTSTDQLDPLLYTPSHARLKPQDSD